MCRRNLFARPMIKNICYSWSPSPGINYLLLDEESCMDFSIAPLTGNHGPDANDSTFPHLENSLQNGRYIDKINQIVFKNLFKKFVHQRLTCIARNQE